MSKGTVILVPFPFTDLSGQKVRPAVVLYSDKRGEDCIVVFISSAKTKRVSRFDIAIVASSTNGLKVPSMIKVNKIATLQKKIVLGELGTLETPYMTKVNTKLRQLFSL